MTRWKLGPSHPDYTYSGPYSYPTLPPGPASQPAPRKPRYTATGPKAGPIVHRRFQLTPEGAAVVSRAETDVVGSPHRVPSATAGTPGHLYCAPSWPCREGRLPKGWVREAGNAS